LDKPAGHYIFPVLPSDYTYNQQNNDILPYRSNVLPEPQKRGFCPFSANAEAAEKD
jgi:hypothetical protein